MPNAPLAEILRPNTLEGFVGQKHLTGEDGIISKIIKNPEQNGYFPSLILWGPPGCGKTTLARIIANELNRKFYEFSAVNTSVKEIEKQIVPKKAFQRSQKDLGLQETKSITNLAPIIFIDEIHRFNKAQQDALLPHVENGDITLIGATTENPSFEVIGPLLSRTRVIVLTQLDEKDLGNLLSKALTQVNKTMDETTQKATILSANGDARVLINLIELASNLTNRPSLDKEIITQALQRANLNFDLKGEEYYNTISALHKSIRGSDPDAALYWLARMLEAGQDPLYIARRLIRCATEDIGIKDPQALILAVAAFQSCERLGMPECNLALAELVVYLAKSPKSNQVYIAYEKVRSDVKKHGNLPVPMHIRNAVTDLMKEVGYGKDYKYEHSDQGVKNPEVEYLPDKLKGQKYL
ncbi:replication-associated recombination protein A [candidate division WWE3 bacterium]|uniref:Replication-associated recombination protein A n=1 Tax=candidate division WWE3 bacterium TaxID=2053526 RepID=A0A7X9DL47_UNCKA|nr:replication-associated recombination protein A [candidate division WWE3 bacterium]